jgi:predicted CXXCH cytochrome family protein
MAIHKPPRIVLVAILVLVGAAALYLFSVKQVLAEEPFQETEAYCLSCHSDPDLSMTLPSGEILSLYISPETLQASVHSPAGIECEACHTEIKTYPHPEIEYESKRELSQALYLACKKCHPSNYERAMDSMHATVAAEGNLDAPVCTDCHGAHDVRPPDEPRSLISTTCGECHNQIYNEYEKSIHGSALIQEDNLDVPVCTDCHGVHDIQDPRTAQFRIDSPDLCASCHADPELMSKYGLSADVYNIYQLSWHGVDVAVYKAKWPTIWHDSAVCTDCHGVHNIRATHDPDSTVNPKNLLTTCQKCHPDAGPNWTDAWTGHNEISLERTPFLFYVDAFYSSFTPFVLWLSLIYVLLQVIHHTVTRVRRAMP